MREQSYNHCPRCGSVRIKKYHKGLNDFFCPRCKQVFAIEDYKPKTCFHCGRIIKDMSRAGEWGNGRYKHIRCRRVKAPGQTTLKEAAL